MPALRHALLGASILAACATLPQQAAAASAAPANAQRMVDFDIPAQGLGRALNELARQARVRIAFPYEEAEGRVSTPLKGRFTALSAAQRLVAQTDLRAFQDANGTIMVVHDEAALSETADDTEHDIIVTGTALRAQEAISERRKSIGIVDTLSQDDIGDLSDETLADALVRMPGVSSMQTLYGEQEAAYVSTRGITPDLNFVSFDGIAMFSSSNDGDGLRRVDLNLIPTQVSRTTQVFKSFTPDHDAGAIGSVINIIPYSALHDRNTFYIDAQLRYQDGTGRYVPGSNSRGHYDDTPWGGGVKGLWVQKFGADDQFGIVLSGVYRQKAYDYTKRNPNNRIYYTPQGATAKSDLTDWDGNSPLPSLIRPMDYTHFTRTFGGSAQVEYRAADDLELSLLGYYYKQIEDQTLNQFYVEQYSDINRTGPYTADLKIGRTRPSYDYDRFRQQSAGAIFKAVKEFNASTSLEFRAAAGENKFYNMDLGAVYASKPTNSRIYYDMSGLSNKISISNNEDLTDASRYTLSSASDFYNNAKMKNYEGRLDFKSNYNFDSEGVGLAAGIDFRKVEAERDQSTITYIADGSPLGSIGYIPGDFRSRRYDYPYLWIDYDAFENGIKPNLGINEKSTGNNAYSGDYNYKERILAGYISGMYANENTRVIAGLRLDNVKYEALVPLATDGIYDGAVQNYKNNYTYVLPSINVIQQLSPAFRLKAAYSRSLGRPAFEDIAQAESRDDVELSISKGNPDLKPRKSDNFDLTAEYFFNGGDGIITVGAFYKKIKDDIYTMTTEQDIGGVTYLVSTPMNASSSKMRGIEVQYINNRIPGLPGIFRDRVGVSLNATRMWADMDYVYNGEMARIDALQYQANWLANASVFYKFGGGEFRVAYNYKSKSPIALRGSQWQTYWLFPQHSLDLAFRYNITDDVILKLSANNILAQDLTQGYLPPYKMRRYELTRNRTFGINLVFKR